MQLINTFLTESTSKIIITQHPKSEEERKNNIEKSKEDPKFSAINGEPVVQLVQLNEKPTEKTKVVYLVTIHKVD